MKKINYLAQAIVIGMSLLGGMQPTLAKSAVQAAPMQTAFVPQVAQPETMTYLLVPTANVVNPSAEGMQAYADALGRAADELMHSELASAIESITMNADMSAMRVVVRNANAAGERQFGRLMREDAEAQSCAQNTQMALMNQASGLRQRGTSTLRSPEAGIVSFQVTLNPENTSNGGGLHHIIDGTLNSPNASGAEVVIENRDATGKRVWSTTVLADGTGYFWMNTAMLSCGSGTRYLLNYGDSITISASGESQTIKVVPLAATLDADTNKLEGSVSLQAGMTAVAQWDATPNDCNDVLQEGVVALDAAGKFAFALPFDVKNNETANLVVRNANQTARVVMSAKSIGLSLSYFRYGSYKSDGTQEFRYGRTLYMRLKPNSQYTVTFDTAINGVQVLTGTATARGFTGFADSLFGNGTYPFIFQLAAGDRVTVTGDMNLTWTIPNLQFTTFNYSAGGFAGKTTPGNAIRIKSTPYLKDAYSTGSCDMSVMYDCAAATANGNGDFSISMPNLWASIVDSVIEFRSIDAQGNFISRPDFVAPIRVFDTYVSGIWHTNGQIDMRQLRGGSQIAFQSKYYSAATNPEYVFGGLDIKAGDVIEIGDGNSITKTITRPAMSAQLDRTTAKFTLSSPAGMKATSFLEDFNRNLGYRTTSASYCLTNTGGNVVRDFSPTGIQNLSKAYFVVTDANKNLHYLSRGFPSFTVRNISLANNPPSYVTVIAQGLSTTIISVTVQVRNADNSLFYSTTLNSDYSGSLNLGNYQPFLSTLTPTQKIIIQAGGETSELVVPNLTIERDAANNRIQGNAVASDPLSVQVGSGESLLQGYGTGSRVKADANGRYIAGFDNLLTCSPVSISVCSAVGLTYYAPNENRYALIQEPGTQPDAFESDDVIASATLYTKTQEHTWHVANNSDWIKFEPTASQLGVTQTIRIVVNPSNVTVSAEFYQYVSDGSGGQTLTSVGSRIGGQMTFDWLPTSATTSTLYVAVSSYSSPQCGYGYTVLLSNRSLWLPAMRR